MKTAPGLLAILFTVSPTLAQGKPTSPTQTVLKPDPKPEIVQLKPEDSSAFVEIALSQQQLVAQFNSLRTQEQAIQQEYEKLQKEQQETSEKALKAIGKDPAKFDLSYNPQTRQFSLVPKREKKP